MAKKLSCAKVSPEARCDHVIRGAKRTEVLFKAGMHAREHGLLELTPELLERIEACIEEE